MLDDWVSHSVSSEMNDELELVSEMPSEASPPSQTSSSGSCAYYGQTLLQRGLVWKTNDNTRLSLSDVYQDAKRLDVHLRARPSYALHSRRYRHHSPSQDSVSSRSQEELTFSVRVKEYKIISRDVWIAGQDTLPMYHPPERHHDLVHSSMTLEEEGLGAPALNSDSVAHEMEDSVIYPSISSPDHNLIAESSSGNGKPNGIPWHNRQGSALKGDALAEFLLETVRLFGDLDCVGGFGQQLLSLVPTMLASTFTAIQMIYLLLNTYIYSWYYR